MLRVEQVGGLAVAFSETDKQTIDRELKRLDPNLFLDFENNGRFVYPVVMEYVGDRHVPPFLPVLVWKDRDGPRPLTLAIVEHVKRLERKDDNLLARIHEANAAHDRKLAEASSEGYDDVTRDFQRRAGRLAVIPRSAGLVASRRRIREQRRA